MYDIHDIMINDIMLDSVIYAISLHLILTFLTIIKSTQEIIIY